MVKDQVSEALLIFVVPPSLETLFARLRARATETADELELRQRNAAIELARQDDYDHVVVNETGQVERTAERIDEIIAEERRAPRGSTRPGLSGRVVTLGLDPVEDEPRTADGRHRARLVEVAVDAAGAGGAAAVHVPRAAGTRGPRGRRGRARRVRAPPGARRHPRAAATAVPGVEPKPIVDRVRADGPLLPPLTLALARWIADHYLAPPALVIRSMLPPGLLERLELVAEVTPAAVRGAPMPVRAPRSDAVDRDLLEQLAGGAATGPRPGRSGGPGRAAPPAPRARGERLDHARLDAARSGRRAALRAPGRLTDAGGPSLPPWRRAGVRRAVRSGRTQVARSLLELATGRGRRRRPPGRGPRHTARQRRDRGARPTRAARDLEVRERPRAPAGRPPGRSTRRPPDGQRPDRATGAAVAARHRAPSRRATRGRSSSTA